MGLGFEVGQEIRKQVQRLDQHDSHAKDSVDRKGLAWPSWDDEETVGGTVTRHVFVNASEGGFGCVICRRVVSAERKIRVSFICGRSHVVPTNSSRASRHGSIQRLELTVSVKGVEADGGGSGERKKHLWSDSAPVLAQIFDLTSWFKTFIRNRLSVEIY